MKKTVAVFLWADLGVYTVAEDGLDKRDHDYVRVTELVEVEFPELEQVDVLQAQIAALDEQAEKVRADMGKKLTAIAQKKQELLALPAPDPYLCGDEDAGDNATALPSEG